MSEEETKDKGEEETTKDSGDGDKPKATSVLDEANSVKEELAKMLKEQRELVGRQEELLAQQMLRGKSVATQGEQKPKEETPKEYRERIMGIKK